MLCVRVCVCSYRFCWWISVGISSRRQSFGNLAFWLLTNRPASPWCTYLYVLPLPRGRGRPLRMLGLATPCHTEGTSAERRMSTVTAGTASWQRALGLRMQTAELFLCVHHLTEKGRRKEERDGAGLTRRDKAATALFLPKLWWPKRAADNHPLVSRTPSVQVVGVDPNRPGVTALLLTSRCGEQHVNVMMWGAYHRLLFGNHGGASITISINSMTSVLNDSIQNTDKSNMLISFIQMGHFQSVTKWIENIKYCKYEKAQEMNYKLISSLL